jgi:hypothetical protein
VHDARARLCGFRVRTFGRRRDQSPDRLLPEADHLVRAHVAADHAVRQPDLKRLIHDATIVRQIRFAPAHEIAERHLLRDAASGRVQHPHDCAVPPRFGYELDFPHALATVAAVLLEDSRRHRSQALRKLFAERSGVAIQMGVGAPAKAPGAIKDFLHTHLEDDVGMGTDPHAVRRYVPQHCIERGAVAPLGEGVDPDQHAIATEKLLAHLIRHIVGITRGLRLNAERGHRLENAMKPVVPWRCRMPLRGVPGPQQCQFAGPISTHVRPLLIP